MSDSRAKPRKPVRPRGGGFGRFVRTLFVWGVMLFVVAPVALVAIYRFVPVPITWLMIERSFQGKGLDHRWRGIDRMSPRLVRAVIAAEDARFCEHKGFDMEAIEKAMENNAKGRKLKGGSTISQQTAKNVFLWPQRSWVRKGFEAYFTVLIEIGWGKRRIMEVYLNSIEWGPGVYGAEAAARKNFGTSAANLSAAQAARLAAILPSPLKWRAAKPGPRMRSRATSINRNARAVSREGLAGCVLG